MGLQIVIKERKDDRMKQALKINLSEKLRS